MAEDHLHHHHARASQRWPRVDWPLPAYRAHVNNERPPHPVDLYLAGAAGHRVQAAWSVIETELCPQARRILERLPRGGSDAEDLVARVRTNWMKDDPNRPAMPDRRQPAMIVRYRGLVLLVNYLVTSGRRLAVSEHRKRRPNLSLEPHDEQTPMQFAATDTPSPVAAAQTNETIALVRSALAQAFNGLSAEQRFLLRMTIGEGMKQKDAGRLLRFSEFKTSRQLSKAHDHLRRALESLSDLQWTPALRSAWTDCWQQLLETVQDQPALASE